MYIPDFALYTIGKWANKENMNINNMPGITIISKTMFPDLLSGSVSESWNEMMKSVEGHDVNLLLYPF